MPNLLAVFGATGQQGGSVVDYVLNDPDLSQRYKIRAITRDVNSDKAKQLGKKVEVVQGDVHDRASLETALTDAHTIFAMTTPSYAPDGLEVEYNDGKTIADVAVEKGAEYIIFSTLPPVREISGGKYTKLTPFDAKAKAEQYIRSLPIQSAFYSPGSFMENTQSLPLKPRQDPDGTWVVASPVSPKTQFPLINAAGDTGKFVGAILAEPDKYEGKTFCAATALYSLEEMIATMSKVTGKTIIYRQLELGDFKEQYAVLAAFIDLIVEVFSYYEQFGYYGPDSEKLVAWAAENARGKLSTFEEYLEAHPLQLT
ncbi:MAG: NmrA-like domain-containing protein 1 [Bathelium mastoideum]|nr:MAG: NmrA-like domain-containing protein 1 [Bathelium mastoideum]KAI9694929.1 MAG: NmrA-like domain-containing protein 1 [Bathelium mastoideum]